MNVLVFRRRRAQDPYRRVPNLNLVPQELRPISRGPVSSLALLVMAVAIALALTSYQTTAESKQLKADLEARLQQMQTPLSEAKATLASAAAIRKEIDSLKARATELQGDLQTLKDRKAAWSLLLGHIMSSRTADITVKSLSFDGVKATIQGQAKGVDKLLAYQDTLSRSPLVANVADFKTSPIPNDPTTVAFEVTLQASFRGP